MPQIFIIWKKELLDTLRDRRTLMAMIVMPMVLMPLLIVGMGKFVEYQLKKSAEQTVKIAFVNEAAAQSFVEFIKKQEKIEVVKIEGDLAEQVRKDEIDAGVMPPNDFEDLLKSQKTVEVKILRDSTNTRSSSALARVTGAISLFNNQILQERFNKEKVDPNILSGVLVVSEDVATEKERGGFGLGFILPLFIVMWATIGGQYTAIDVSAGEKERKTLESLLLTPAKRLEIVFGKFLAISTVAMISIIIALTSLYFAFNYFGFMTTTQTGQLSTSSQTMQAATPSTSIDFSLDLQAIPLLFFISLLLVLMFSAVLLSIGIFAKSYKEAQNYIGPAYMFVILPVVFINSIPDFKPDLWFFCLPAINAVLLFKEILLGVYDWGHILVTIASQAVYALVAILIASRIYSKETVLFKE